MNKFGMSWEAIRKAKKRKDLVCNRTRSEANKLSFQHGRDNSWSEEAKEKASKSKKEYYKKYPECHPNRRLANRVDRMTYPEKLVFEYLTQNNVNFEHQVKIDKYFGDFKVGNKIIEIDGAYWHRDKDREQLRDSIIKSYGYEIYHIPAKNVLEHLKKIIP